MSIVIDIKPDRYGGGRERDLFDDQSMVEVQQKTNEPFLAVVLPKDSKRIHFSSRDQVATAHYSPWGRHNSLAYRATSASLLVQAAHGAFAGHVPLSLRPDTIFYTIVHEIGVHVRMNSDRYGRLFSTTPGTKQKIKVTHDGLAYNGPSNWDAAIKRFQPKLEERVGEAVCKLFEPDFSTTTDEDKISNIVALMGVVSPFYDFSIATLCHIPKVRLEGTAEDWAILHERTQQFREMFPLLRDYLDALLSVLKNIADTAAGNRWNEQFWNSLYKYRSESGGEYVTGWINALFAHKSTEEGLKPKSTFNWSGDFMTGRGGTRTDGFPSLVSFVPFEWGLIDEHLDMGFFAGITGVDYASNTFLEPRLGYGVVELGG